LPLLSVKVIVAVRFGLIDELTATSEATAAVPVLAAATDAVTGAAAAIPFGSSSARTIDRVAGETGWSRKRSRAAGAGAAMSMRKPSTTLPFVTVCAVPSLRRVRR
jgi:hypothetical protein